MTNKELKKTQSLAGFFFRRMTIHVCPAPSVPGAIGERASIAGIAAPHQEVPYPTGSQSLLDQGAGGCQPAAGRGDRPDSQVNPQTVAQQQGMGKGAGGCT